MLNEDEIKRLRAIIDKYVDMTVHKMECWAEIKEELLITGEKAVKL